MQCYYHAVVVGGGVVVVVVVDKDSCWCEITKLTLGVNTLLKLAVMGPPLGSHIRTGRASVKEIEGSLVPQD